PGMGEVLALEPHIDAQFLAQPGRSMERGRTADVAREPVVELGTEGGILPRRRERLLEFGQGSHQSLGSEATSVVAESPRGVGPIESGGGHACFASSMNRRIRSASLTPGDDSRPEESSTPNGRTARTASATLSGDSPPARRKGLSRSRVLQSKVSPLPPGSSGWGVSTNSRSSGAASIGTDPALTARITRNPRRRGAAAATAALSP